MTQGGSSARSTGRIARFAARTVGLSVLRVVIGLLALVFLLLHALTPA